MRGAGPAGRDAGPAGRQGGITRRGVVLFGLATLAAAGSAAFGADRLLNRLPAGVPDVDPGPLVSGTFLSRREPGVRVAWRVAYPPGQAGARLPVLVALHGRGGNCDDAFDGALHLDRYLAAAVAAGTAPFAIASVDGGSHSYWHPRHGGDPAGMVLAEFLPLLTARGLRTARIGLLGWSMGGYGALYLAQRLGAARCGVVIAESPAIWHHSWQSAEGAFDDAADFDAHAVLGPRLRRLRGIAVRVGCGDQDGFAPITRDVRAALVPPPAGGIEPGGHDSAYWRSQAPAQLRFAGRHLAAVR